MRIRSVKLVKSVPQNAVEAEDTLRRPKIPNLPLAPKPNLGPLGFQNGRLHYQGKEIGDVVKNAKDSDPQFLSKIATHIQEHKKFQLDRARRHYKPGAKGDQLLKDVGDAVALCDAWLARLGDTLKTRYDQTQTGLHVNLDEDNQLLVNGMNVTACVETCKDNPTPKSKLFLKGVRNRLYYILQNKADSKNYERLHEVVERLFEEIDDVLAQPVQS